MAKYSVSAILQHRESGKCVVVTGDPRNYRIEATNEPAYAYREIGDNGVEGPVWIRPQHEMEDGRFENGKWPEGGLHPKPAKKGGKGK